MNGQEPAGSSAGIYKAARFAVQPDKLEACKDAIREFVASVRHNEPGTRFYLSLQDKRDPTQFLHVMSFEDEAAEMRHRGSAATRRFVETLSPELAEPVAFTDYALVAPT